MPLTIVMYHYVRDLQHSRYPAIKGQRIEHFRAQLDYIERHYTVVNAEEVVEAAIGDHDLPDNALWLTFDDGYSDHYTMVFPLLMERRWQGSFFAPSMTTNERRLLDVNKIHFILACQPNTDILVSRINAFITEHKDSYELEAFDAYWSRYATASRYDPAEIIFVKRMLQKGLPEDARNQLSTQLFSEFVTHDEAMFAEELYLTTDQAKMMVRSGMYFGSHGARHYWFNQLNAQQQEAEITDSLSFLNSIGAPTNHWVMCYPHGSYDETTLQLLKKHGCAVGLTTEVGIADPGKNAPLLLPRLNTNDIPCLELSQTTHSANMLTTA